MYVHRSCSWPCSPGPGNVSSGSLSTRTSILKPYPLPSGLRLRERLRLRLRDTLRLGLHLPADTRPREGVRLSDLELQSDPVHICCADTSDGPRSQLDHAAESGLQKAYRDRLFELRRPPQAQCLRPLGSVPRCIAALRHGRPVLALPLPPGRGASAWLQQGSKAPGCLLPAAGVAPAEHAASAYRATFAADPDQIRLGRSSITLQCICSYS